MVFLSVGCNPHFASLLITVIMVATLLVLVIDNLSLWFKSLTDPVVPHPNC